MELRTILAGDLSLSCPAFAVMQIDISSGKLYLLEKTHVKTNSKKSLGYRLWQIAEHVEMLLDKYAIDYVVIEKGFSKFNTATHQIQRVVGLMVYSIYRKHRLDLEEIAVTTCKKAVTGNGKATKEEVAEALEQYVGPQKYATNDESDATAVGVAFCKGKGWI